MKKFYKFIIAFLPLFIIAGCNNSVEESSSQTSSAQESSTVESVEKQEIRIGGTAISEKTYNAIKPVYEELGYTTEFVMFDSNPVVLEAANSGDVDMALGQHKKYVETFNKDKGADLEMVKPYGYYTGIGLYSEKHDSVDAIPEGGKIGIMNDAQNRGIALRILAEQGLISLNADIDNPTIADITENPKNLEIIEMDQAQTVTALQDMDAAAVFFTHMSNAGKDPQSFIARDTDMINYPMGPITKSENAQEKWATNFAESFKDQSVRDAVEKALPGVFEFYENDSQVKE